MIGWLTESETKRVIIVEVCLGRRVAAMHDKVVPASALC